MTDAGQTAVPRTSAARRERQQERLRWAAALLLALGWQISWIAWFRIRPPPPPRSAPSTPIVAYLPPGSSGPDGAADPSEDVRATWSPALFSLPTLAGFSRTAMTNEIGMRPPVKLPGGSPVLLERAGTASGPLVAARAGPEDEVAARLDRLEPPPPPPAVFATSAAATGLVVRAELSGGLAGARFQPMELEVDASIPRDRAWEVKAWVEVGEDGRVKHVFLETASPFEALNALIHRTLLGWRLVAASGPCSGRITLRWNGFAPSAAARNGGRP